MITAHTIYSNWKLITRTDKEKRIGISTFNACTEIYEMAVRGGNLIRTVETVVAWGSPDVAISESVVFIPATVPHDCGPE